MSSIRARRHKLTLCRQEDVVIADGTMILNREAVTWLWAEIVEKKASTFSPHGATMGESRDARTHQIMVRYSTQFNPSVMAWLYEHRLKSSPRWFKILKVGQTEDCGPPYFKFDVRLVERADDAPTPSHGPVVGLPSGVTL